ncbi:hypothetical protein SAMN04488029_3433 [Reichenbachiella faecimaris]|uniref:Uncharacterized protein n=1 Tax=Reichenbachiella faecimaris TaxID=692418 RepID=A0A1W2GMQ8_REIFA|nr:hypothetical protein [Reichenbachiella faecimaris]SMD37732.1 hypothetical protein SAMN04488029_3433 [Reichenbachiella faecimaris]
MKIKVLTLKNWCNKSITPLAWQRIIIKILPEMRDRGFELNALEDPAPDLTFGEEEFQLFTNSLDTVYKITFPKEVLEKIS